LRRIIAAAEIRTSSLNILLNRPAAQMVGGLLKAVTGELLGTLSKAFTHLALIEGLSQLIEAGG
jgi:hypothetical protein